MVFDLDAELLANDDKTMFDLGWTEEDLLVVEFKE
jgi:hypothetical protein